MLDPQELYELDSDRPDLTDTVLVVALDGFVDAGSTTRIARQHVLDALDHQVLVRFDVDQLFDYRARRPLMRFARDHWESYDEPQLVIHLLTDDAGTPFLMLSGPEPDAQWERFVAAVRRLITELGVRLTVGLDAFPMSLPHTRPTRVILHGSRPELYAGYKPWLGVIGVPASAGHLLEYRLGKDGIDALGLAAPVPPYVSETEYPAASVALLRELCDRTGLSIPLTALHEAAVAARRSIDEQVAANAEVSKVVEALEVQYDSYVEGQQHDNLLAEDGELPSADELGAELERFLANRPEANRPDPGMPDPGLPDPGRAEDDRD